MPSPEHVLHGNSREDAPRPRVNRMTLHSHRRKLYPALVAWQERDGNTPHATWAHDGLWRAAMAEAEAREHRDNPERERACQVEAVLALLNGKCAGDPAKKYYPKVVLDVDMQRRYLQRIREPWRGSVTP